MNRLEIQIATHGKDGLASILSRQYPLADGVMYRVGWQGGESRNLADNIIVNGNKVRSLTENRNCLIELSDAEIILFGDNDISYTYAQISNLIASFDNNPAVDFICFRLDRDDKKYPDEIFDITIPKRGYFPSSCEIAVRKSFLDKHNVRFDTRFGLSARFICFEEYLFVNDLLNNGARGIYLPVIIGHHESETSTGTNLDLKREVEIARGAALGIVSPCSAPLRLVVQAYRNKSFQYLFNGLRGYFSVLFRPNRCDI
ncbi:MAG: hypothetical protein K2I94_08110 [Muribaculaceae bacterium]|nr:hypothetical protein [Muribaculaceae bacterium]